MTAIRAYRAAGGVVLDDQDKVLTIERWVVREGRLVHEIRLPKGHVETGESDEEAALREVCEETGYCDLQVIDDLHEQITEFQWRGEFVHRTEHYYLMRLKSDDQDGPHFDSEHSEEALFRPCWEPDLATAAKKATFPSERVFLMRAAALRSD